MNLQVNGTMTDKAEEYLDEMNLKDYGKFSANWNNGTYCTVYYYYMLV